MARPFIVLVIGLLLTAAYATTVQANSFLVNNAADAGDANLSDGVCNTSVIGICTLRASIQQANALVASGPHTISLMANTTYVLTLGNQPPTLAEDNAVMGDLDIKSNVTITGAGSSSTFIDA